MSLLERTNVENKHYYSSLLSIYGALLTKKQEAYLYAYFAEDYSLSEIAQQYGVTRVAIHNQITNTCAKMDLWESKLKLHALLQQELPRLADAIDLGDIEQIRAHFTQLKKTIEWSEE